MNGQQRLSIFIVLVGINAPLYRILVYFITPLFIHHFYDSSIYTAIILSVYTFFIIYAAKKLHISWSQLGLNLNNWKANIIESCLWSILFCIAIFIIELFLLKTVSLFHNISLFTSKFTFSTFNVLLLVVYIVFDGLQVFIINGFIQSLLQDWLDIKYKYFFSILITILMFINFHFILGIAFALIITFPTILWCIIYAKQRSLLGVYVSHVIIGVFALYVLSYNEIIYDSQIALSLFLG